MKKRVYAYYKGDNFVDMGTADELAKKIGVNAETIVYYATKTYREKRAKENSIIVIKVDDDAEETITDRNK